MGKRSAKEIWKVGWELGGSQEGSDSSKGRVFLEGQEAQDQAVITVLWDWQGLVAEFEGTGVRRQRPKEWALGRKQRR